MLISPLSICEISFCGIFNIFKLKLHVMFLKIEFLKETFLGKRYKKRAKTVSRKFPKFIDLNGVAGVRMSRVEFFSKSIPVPTRLFRTRE